MPSPAFQSADQAFENSKSLRLSAVSARTDDRNAAARQVYYHASLALSVAAWDAYLNNIVRNFYSVVVIAGDQKFLAMKALAEDFSGFKLNKFNTANFENSRELIVKCTGYDPYGDWGWKRRRLTVLQVSQLLNQILKVRHSFAHGFPVPTYPWTQSPSGKVRLTNSGVKDSEDLLRHLVSATDSGIASHIQHTYSIVVQW